MSLEYRIKMKIQTALKEIPELIIKLKTHTK